MRRPLSLVGFVGGLGDLRPGETRRTAFLFVLFFFITAPAYIIKPVRESFLLNFDPGQFPYADLITAALIGFVVSLNATLLQRLRRRRYVTAVFAFFIACLLVFWVLFGRRWAPLAFVYWFWSDVFIATSVTLFWIAVSDAYNPNQAKRLIGIFVLGGLLGGIAGSLLSLSLVRVISTRDLLLVCPALLAGTLAAANLFYRDLEKGREDRPPEGGVPRRVGYLEGFRILRRSRYLFLLAGGIACAMIVGKLVDYQFKTLSKAAFPILDVRTSFLSTFNLGLLAVSAVFHLFMTGRVLRRSGIRTALLVAPVILILGSAAVFLVPAGLLIAWAVFARGVDKSLDNTLNQSARELLYIPAPAESKYKAKMFIDLFVNKFATGFAGLLFLLLYRVLRVDIRLVSLPVLAFLGAWILLAGRVSREYVGVVRKDLVRRWEDGEDVVARHVDVDTTRLVFDTLQSRDRSATLYAMNLYDLLRKEDLPAEVRELLTAKSGEIQARSMDALLETGGESFLPGAEAVLAEDGFETEVREIMGLQSYRQVMEDHIGKVLAESREMDVARMEAAKILGFMPPTERTIRDLILLLQDSSPEVLHYALDSAARLGRKEFVPLLLRHLAHPAVSQVAADALVAYGQPILGTLRDALMDAREPEGVRRVLPAVLGRIGGQAAAGILQEALAGGPPELEEEATAALYRAKLDGPAIVLDEALVRRLVLREIGKSYRDVLEGRTGEACGPSTPGRPGTGAFGAGVKRIFDLLSLRHSPDDMARAYQNLCQGTRKAVDYALELLDNVLDPELKGFLFPLIEDLPPDERARRLRRLRPALEAAAARRP